MTDDALLDDRDPTRTQLDWVLIAILFLTFTLRLIDVGQPFFDLQTWRQADTAAIARNYFEEGFDFFHPRVDWRGDGPGYVEMEFPLYPYLVACLYALFGGVHESLGYLLSALFSTGTVPFVYLLARRFHGRAAARIAAFVFAVAPLDVFFGRAFMPDATMLFFSVGAVWLFLRWTEDGRLGAFVGATVFTALAALVKVPALYLGLPLLFLAYQRFGLGLFRQPKLWAFALCTLGPTLLWYYYAYTLFEQTHLTFGIWTRYGYAKWGNPDVLAQGSFYLLMLERLSGVVLTPVGFALLLVGVLLPVRDPRERVFHVWLLALVFFVLFAAEGNRIHNHYQLPFIPVAAIFVGKVLGGFVTAPFRWPVLRSTPVRAAVVGALLLAMVGFSYRYARPLFARQPFYVAQWEICQEVDALIPKDALLVTGELDDNTASLYRSQSPIMLYFCHRKGWQLLPKEFAEKERLDGLAQKGARYFLVPIRLVYGVEAGLVSMTLIDTTGNEIAQFRKDYLKHRAPVVLPPPVVIEQPPT